MIMALSQDIIYLLVNMSVQGDNPLWLPGADLSGLNLEGAPLAGAYLAGAILKRANLRGADLQGAGSAAWRANSRIRRRASGSRDLQLFRRSLACFLYCSMVGRAGRSRAGIRIPFHRAWSPPKSG